MESRRGSWRRQPSHAASAGTTATTLACLCAVAWACTARAVAGTAVLPVACNIANSSSQAILSATQTFSQENAGCETSYAHCKFSHNTSAHCAYDCRLGVDDLIKVCVDNDGHMCNSHVTATKNPYTPTLDYYTAFCLPNDCDHDLVPSVETWLTNAECTNIPHSMCSVNLDCKYSTSPLVIVAIIFVGLVGAIIVVGSLCYAHEWWRGRRRHMSSIEQSGLLDEERPDLMEPRL